MKGKNEVIKDFNGLVNMTSSELEKWLKSSDSSNAGWPKASEDGESVGHDSGRKIVQILKENPHKNPDKYTDDQIEHMRKVVAYCKRHLAQESAVNEKKSTEELKNTKSYASLKNWGHDILKEQNGKADDSDEAGAGNKRSRQDGPAGDNKARKTKKSSSAQDEQNQSDDVEDTGSNVEEEKEIKNEMKEARSKSKNRTEHKTKANNEESEESAGRRNGHKNDSTANSKNGEPDPGDTVSWNWGQGQPEGKVLDVKHEKASITTKRGNEVSRDGSEKDPAIVLDTGKSKAIKLNHELN
ncbi:hypothetical protein QQS21_009089 [Conoideocrella luteorostrata]|uniref:Hypervirulence associated protein TUDOR domain-containing protein n=1 Tax=Conoideocrella luteorostrata TaxID=1105319 RepID=A0AAJ0FQR6_9HYPO|nr:hypothetical protein QQS21_009089 [Conoideocrella luteorostrata]